MKQTKEEKFNIIFKSLNTLPIYALTQTEVLDWKFNNLDRLVDIKEIQPCVTKVEKASKDDFMHSLTEAQLKDIGAGVKKVCYSESENFWYIRFSESQEKEFFSPNLAVSLRQEKIGDALKNWCKTYAYDLMEYLNDGDLFCTQDEIDLVIKKMCFHG